MGMNGRNSHDSFPGPIKETRAASTAAGGTALTTTAAIVGFPNGTSHVSLVARNFSTAVVVKFALNPYLHIIKTVDGLATVTDFSAAGQQNPASTGINLDAFSTLANLDALYIGAFTPFRGVAVTMSASVNAVASVLSIDYWNGSIFTAVSGGSDGTASAGKTFAQTGNITWTVPTDWTKALLPQAVNPALTAAQANQAINTDDGRVPRFWARFSVSATLSANTKPNTMFALNRSTAYAEMVSDSLIQFSTQVKGTDPDGIACVEALTDAGTANLIVNCFTDSLTARF